MSNLLFFQILQTCLLFLLDSIRGKGRFGMTFIGTENVSGHTSILFPSSLERDGKAIFSPSRTPNIRCTHIPYLEWYRIQAVTFHTSNHSTHTHIHEKRNLRTPMPPKRRRPQLDRPLNSFRLETGKKGIGRSKRQCQEKKKRGMERNRSWSRHRLNGIDKGVGSSILIREEWPCYYVLFFCEMDWLASTQKAGFAFRIP